MALNLIISLLPLISVTFALLNGKTGALTGAVIEGAGQSVKICLSLCGMICFWQAVMQVMQDCGLASALARALSPVIKRLWPSSKDDSDTRAALAENISANLLGLGNAATPAGIRAAKGLVRLAGGSAASDELCLLVVMNTASIQLIPTTVAALRASLGAASPFDILPAVWLSSACSVTAGISAAGIFSRFSRT